MLILRTHLTTKHASDHARLIAREAGYDFCIAIDTSFGVPENWSDPIVHVNDHAYSVNGLYHRGFNAKWQCGDYALYLAYTKFPNYDFYWMIEHDVFFNFGDLKRVFFEFDKWTRCDFLTVDLAKQLPDWHWFAASKIWYDTPWKCVFPVARFSRGATEHLFSRRIFHSTILKQELSQSGGIFYGKGPEQIWPNDEAFVASTLKSGKFVCRDINDLGEKLYDKASFGFNMYFSLEDMVSKEHANKICHSVLDQEELLNKKQRRPDLFGLL
jgi:hypothetical protein